MNLMKFPQKTSFSEDLKQAVEHYFVQNRISKTGNSKLHVKTIIGFTSIVLLYIVLVFFTPSYLWLSLFLCGLLGFTFAFIGFNVMHDGSHGSYSESKKINSLMAKSLDLLGASSIIWDRKHNIAHHTYTNIENHDDDINVSPWLRLSPDQKWHRWYRMQLLYMWILYAIEYIVWIIVFDTKKYFNRKVGSTNIVFSKNDHYYFWITKVVYAAIFIVFPMIKVGVIPTLIGYSVAAAVCGLCISIVFQLAHVQEKSSFHAADVAPKDEFLIHQIQTTANFAPNNKVISWLVGGLNFQIEHHLFREVSHVHYPAIRKIVKRVCEKHNVEYKEYRTFIGAFISHIKHMHRMGFNLS